MFRVKLLIQIHGLVLMSLLCFVVVSSTWEIMTKMIVNNPGRRAMDLDVPYVPLRMVPKQRPQHHKGNKRGLINVRDICMNDSFEEESVYDYGRLMQNRSIYYCHIPKCGSTFMAVFFDKLFASYNSTNYFKVVTQREDLPDAYSFTFVRDPYGRLFSAYENKFFHPNEMWKKLGTDVIRVVRPGASSLSKHIGHDVTFAELVKYVITLHEQGIPVNRHLAPMKSSCDPCKKRFDFIGRLETMTDDLVYLVNQWKYRDVIPENISSVVSIESEAKYLRIFGRISHLFYTLGKYRKLLSKYKLLQRTWSSYQMRGIIQKSIEMPFTELNARLVNMTMFKEAITEAMESSKPFKEGLKAQRQEALIQAYRTVPLELMFKLREFVKTDCALFGYDDKPEKLFIRTVLTQTNDHDYFKGL